MSKQILDIFSSIHLHGGSFCLSLSSDCVWLRLLLQAKTHPRSGPSKTGEHGPFEWGRRVCGGLSSALGVARCGRSAGCVLCVLWAMSAAVGGGGSLGGVGGGGGWGGGAGGAGGGGGGYPVGVSISSSPRPPRRTPPRRPLCPWDAY